MPLMSSSRDAATCYSLMRECIEMRAPPEVWSSHLAGEAQRLVGGCSALLVFSHVAGAVPVTDLVSIAPTVDVAIRSRIVEVYANGGLALQPELPVIAPIVLKQGRLVYRQGDLVDSRTFLSSRLYQAFLQSVRIDESLASVRLRPDGVAIGLAVQRHAGDSRFGSRQAAILEFLNVMIDVEYGRSLSTRSDETAGRLPARLVPVLHGLLSGASDKAIARTLSLSHHTVHEYVQDLYRHFDVHSRAHLLSRLANLAGGKKRE